MKSIMPKMNKDISSTVDLLWEKNQSLTVKICQLRLSASWNRKENKENLIHLKEHNQV
jgi:hypothetical protein